MERFRDIEEENEGVGCEVFGSFLGHDYINGEIEKGT